MNLILKFKSVFILIKNFISPPKGMYYIATTRKIDSNKPIKLRDKPILLLVNSEIKTNHRP